MRKPNILFFDIETSPNVGVFWRPGSKVSISYKSILRERAIICLSYKFSGRSNKVHTLVWDKKQNDKTLLKRFIKIMSKADAVMGHNGDAFDIKWLNGRCAHHNILINTDIQSLDTLKISRSVFNLNSHKLDYLCQYFGLGRKVQTGGLDLWLNVMENDEKALRKMVKYCEQDVVILEQLFNKIAPYAKRLPVHLGSIVSKVRTSCPLCGSVKNVIHSTRTTASGVQHKMRQCKDCNKFFKAERCN